MKFEIHAVRIIGPANFSAKHGIISPFEYIITNIQFTMKIMMRTIAIACLMTLMSFSLSAQKIAIKNNLLYTATLTPNLGIEAKLGNRVTLDIIGGYHPYKLQSNRFYKHWLVQPEVRLWTCEAFNGSFFGLHVHGGEFNIAGIKMPFGIFPKLKNHRYEGSFYGAGVSYGHQWILSRRWSLEATIGLGYARIDYDKFECQKCGPLLESGNYDYFGPTRMGVSFIYFFR